MTSRIAILAAACVFGAGIAAAAHVDGRQAASPAAEHQHAAQAPAATAGQPPAQPKTGMMAAMKDADRKLDDLVQKMNTSKGDDKIDAMAELLTTLVRNHHAMHESMMSGMMDVPPAAKK